MNKKILFLVPDGVGIRNYLFSDIIRQLKEQQYEISILHNLCKEAIDEVEKKHQIKFEQYKLQNYIEKPFHKFLRESICYARLINNTKLKNNTTILSNWIPKKKGIKKIFYTFVEVYGKHLSKKYSRILQIEKYYEKHLHNVNNPYQEILKKIKPNTIFNTHQRALNAILPIIAAQKLEIRNIGAIYSWDNLPKARLTVRTSEYVVWSDYMKDELNTYYPEINNVNIHVTGTPQFEFYFDKNLLWTRKYFYNKFNLDINKKIAVYSGGDLKTSPYDHLYLEEIAKQIAKLPSKNQIQILLRPTPVDTSIRFTSILKKYPNILKISKPIWIQSKDWSRTYPSFEDVILLANVIYHTETVINVGSTMAFDYAAFNKPAIYLDFNIVNESEWNIKTINRFQHFKSMTNLNAVFWWKNKKDFNSIMTQVINSSFQLEYNAWSKKINNFPQKASNNIVDLLSE